MIFLKMRAFLGTSLPILVIRNFGFLRYFHTNSIVLAVDKAVLSKLRKSTGFSISHCKKSLELHENDLQKAEEWLRKEAQAHGWEKATKLSGRSTTQGLIGIHIEGNVGSIVEVNCETDFVARNAEFQTLVSNIVKEFATYSNSQSKNIESPRKEFIDKEKLGNIQTNEGKSVSDLIALAIGKLGENIKISKGIKFISPPNLDLVGYTHPPSSHRLLGRYGAIVAFKNSTDKGLTRELCAHIVGMNPKQVGSLNEVEEKKNEDIDKRSAIEEKEFVDEEEDQKEIKKKLDDEEKPLVHQEFLSDSDSTVGQVLKENDMEIVDFIRIECGELQPGV